MRDQENLPGEVVEGEGFTGRGSGRRRSARQHRRKFSVVETVVDENEGRPRREGRRHPEDGRTGEGSVDKIKT